MNILFTTPTYYPHKGGAESSIADLATQFAKLGHNVTVITSRTDESLAARETRDGVEVCRIKYPPTSLLSINDALLVLIRTWSALFQIFQTVRRRKIATVCLGLVGIDSLLILLLHQLLNFKLIVYIHGGELRSYIKVSPVIRWTLKRCLKNCFAVIAVSEELKTETVAFVPDVAGKIFVIPNGVPTADIDRVKPHEHHRKYFLFVGRLHPVKGIETLIRAFQKVVDRLPDWDLMIAGSGTLEADLKKLASEHGTAGRIIFLGDRERSDVFALMKGCEFMVLPSFAEGCPISVLEAAAAGKVTIGSNAKGIANLIQHNVNGLLFEAGNVDALGDLLLHCATDLPARNKLEEKLRGFDRQRYDSRNLAAKHLLVYAGVSDPLRICLISSFYYHDENCAGLASYYFNLAESLAAQGNKVSLITAEHPGNGRQTRVQTFELKQKPIGNHRSIHPALQGFFRVASRFRFSVDAYRKFKELERASGVDIITAPELFAPALLIGALRRHKLFTRLHTPTYIGDSYNGRSRLIGQTLSFVEKAQARRSAGLSVASETLASLIARDWRIPREKIRVIPNSVQVEWVRSLSETRPREIPGEYLLYVGRLEKRKGVHVIARALPDIFTGDSKIKMVFVGRDVGLKDEILRLNKPHHDRIVFLDTVEKPKLFGLMRHSKMILLPSLFENMSIAGLEAMALGKPVVGTYQTSFEEIIEDDVDGFLVKPGNAEALSSKVLSCLALPNLEEVGQNAYRKVMQFDSSRIVLQKIEFYRTALLAL